MPFLLPPPVPHQTHVPKEVVSVMVTSDRRETLFGTLLHVQDLDVGGVQVFRLIGYELGTDHHAPFLGVNPPAYRTDLVAEYTSASLEETPGDLQIVEEIAYAGDSLENPLADTNTLATFKVHFDYYRNVYNLRYESGTSLFTSAGLPDAIAIALITASRQHAVPDRHEKRLTERLAVDPRESVD